MGIAWKGHEDTLLTQTVLDHCKRGASINEALAYAAKKLNRTSEACSGRWYDNFQEMFKEEIKKLKQVTKRTNDYVGEWQWHDDEKFIKLMVDFLIQDYGKVEAFENSAKELGRSTSSCQSRWYTYIIKRNKLTIENLIARGKEQMSNTQVGRTWTREKEIAVVNLLKGLIKDGIRMITAFEKVGNHYNVSAKTIQNYWYAHLYPEHREELETIRNNGGGRSYTKSWDDEQRYQLFKFITSAKEKGNQKMVDIIAGAAEALNKPKNECHNLWYNSVVKDQQLKMRYTEEKNKVISNEWTPDEDAILVKIVLEFTQIGKTITSAFKEVSSIIHRTPAAVEFRWRNKLQYAYATELRTIQKARAKGEIAVVEIPEVEMPMIVETIEPVVEKTVEQKQVENPVIQAVDLTQTNEFVVMIQKLIKQNQDLQKDKSDLQSELQVKNLQITQYEEIKQNYEIAMKAMERARQFIIDSELGADKKVSN